MGSTEAGTYKHEIVKLFEVLIGIIFISDANKRLVK